MNEKSHEEYSEKQAISDTRRCCFCLMCLLRFVLGSENVPRFLGISELRPKQAVKEIIVHSKMYFSIFLFVSSAPVDAPTMTNSLTPPFCCCLPGHEIATLVTL